MCVWLAVNHFRRLTVSSFDYRLGLAIFFLSDNLNYEFDLNFLCLLKLKITFNLHTYGTVCYLLIYCEYTVSIHRWCTHTGRIHEMPIKINSPLPDKRILHFALPFCIGNLFKKYFLEFILCCLLTSPIYTLKQPTFSF